MKREIEFRGKTAKGEWVYGDLVRIPNGDSFECYIISDFDDMDGIYDVGKYAIKVIHETVGQYTGLTDKNGKKIFEQDKVKFTDTTFGYSHIGEVCFDKGSFCILYEGYARKELHRIGKIDKSQEMGASLTITYSYEVIGNIFDKESENDD